VPRKKLPHRRGAAEVEVISLDDKTVIAVSGDVDVAASDQLRLAARWAADRNLPVRIDLADATLLDTSGLELVSKVAATERERGRTVVMVGASSRIKASLRITGLDHLVQFDNP
jgi:anti-anti-sigma factor